MESCKIYRIVCNISNEIYIGSTCGSLSSRISSHKSSYKQSLKGNQFNRPITSHKIIEKNNFWYDIVEECSKEDLLERERYYIENTENCINKNIPHRNSYEYRLANIDKKKEYDRKRYIMKKIEKQIAEINFDD